MEAYPTDRPSWRDILDEHAPLLLPAAHDALTARLIERAGFNAYQIGGYALAAARYAHPDIDLEHFGEKYIAAMETIAASRLPVMVDADDGYGDSKNVVRVVQTYEAMGVSAIFLEDQKAPKRCGHMANKTVIRADHMVNKIRAAVAVRRSPEFFIMARTDAREPLGLDEALRRGEAYLKAGADALFVEAPHSVEELERIGREFAGMHLAANMLEGGGKTPILTPSELSGLGFSMILYPTSIVLRLTVAIQHALEAMRRGDVTAGGPAVSFDRFEDILGLPYWQEIETRYDGSE